jgi:hypothetical protein
LLCVLLVFSAPVPAAPGGNAQDKGPTIQERLVLLPAGCVVEVKTDLKKKITGRLGALNPDSFELQTAKGANIEKLTLRYDEVKSVKQLDHKGMGTAAKITVGILAGLGVLVVIGIIIAAAHGFDS